MLDGYPVGRHYDEMFTAAGGARPDYRRLHSVVAGLDRREWGRRYDLAERSFRNRIARSTGVPCRYVSGDIHPGGRVGSGASHAWAEAFCGGRWLGYDPSNPVREGAHHVRVAVGRDYHDVPPTRGVYKGAATERMTVSVDVHLLT
jgi:hypothetical protein